MANLDYKHIEGLIADGHLDEAKALIKCEIAQCPNGDNAWFYLGRILWREGNHGASISAYERAVAINSESPARVALEMGRDVIDYFNPDLLNP